MKSSLILLLLMCTNLVTAQIKIGDNPQMVDPSSLLELESSSKVLVISRMSEAEILALSPLQGAMVYNTDAACIFYYDGTNWNNLCAGGSTGDIAWGAITGNLSDQADLEAEFQNYVNLTTAQSIAGEKTLTEKFTVNTGTTTDQIAEFLGRVKGEEGTAPEDFVTKAQLDALSGGVSGTEGSIFFADALTQPTEDNANLFWDSTIGQLRVGDNPPAFGSTNSTVNIQGSISKPITFGATGLNETNHTTIIDFDATVFLPVPGTCTGRIYIIKKRPNVTITIDGGYIDSNSDVQSTLQVGVLQLQSSGFNWEQIN